jgi:hypothetical protein
VAFAVDFPNQYAYLTGIFNFCQENTMAIVISQTIKIRCNKLIKNTEVPSASDEVVTDVQLKDVMTAVESVLEGTGVFVEFELRPVAKASVTY